MTTSIALHVKRLVRFYSWEELKRCPLCSSRDIKPHSRYMKNLVSIKLSVCRECGMIFQNPRMTTESLKRFYRSDYRGGAAKWAHKAGHEKLFERGLRRGAYISDFLSSNGIRHDNRVVFEAGSGYGGILEYFKRRGCKVKGCDLNPVAAEYSAIKGLDTEVGDIDVIGRYEIRADILILSHVLEHVPDHRAFLECVKDIVKPKGVVYIEVPGVDSPKKDMKRCARLSHLLYFNLKTLSRMLDEAGFTAISGNELVQGLFKKQ